MIYLDAHATTPVDPRVLDAMLPFFREHFGNASSRNHPFGWKAAKAVERAREQVAELVGARLREVVFTSGATESNNLAIKAWPAARRGRSAAWSRWPPSIARCWTLAWRSSTTGFTSRCLG